MTDILFTQTRFDYRNPANGFGSYHDFFRLAELSGFPIIYVDEIDPTSDNVYIYAPHNGETINGWSGARARIIFWCLEQGVPDKPIPGLSEIWVSDAHLAEISGARYVLMGSHFLLAHDYDSERDTDIQREYDVITLTYNTPRRDAILNELRELGVRVAPNGWNEERHRLLKSSSAMLHMHQTEGLNYAAPQRFALAAAYSLPLITEQLDHPGPFAAQFGRCLSSDRANLATFTRDWVCRNDHHALADYGHSLYQFLCVQHPFEREVKAAL